MDYTASMSSDKVKTSKKPRKQHSAACSVKSLVQCWLRTADLPLLLLQGAGLHCCVAAEPINGHVTELTTTLKVNLLLTEPLRLLLSNIKSSNVMSAEAAPDRTEASSARPLGVATPPSESTCMPVLAWIVSLPAAALDEAAQLMYDACPWGAMTAAELNAVGVHSAAFGLSNFMF